MVNEEPITREMLVKRVLAYYGDQTLEAMINQELGEPFRRDAMKKPVKVAGIDKADMRPQAVE